MAGRTTEQLRIRLLGGAALEGTCPAAESVLSQPKAVAFIARLAAVGEPFVQRDLLLGLLWGDIPERKGRNALNQLVFRLRRDLGQETLVSRGREQLGLGPSVASDVRELERAIAEGRLDETMTLYRGELLPGFHLSGLGQFERWLEQRRSELAGRARQAAIELGDRLMERGEWPEAVRRLRRAISFWPHDETLMRRLLLALDSSGERAEALRTYQRFGRELAAELGIEPSPETQELAAGLRADHVSVAQRGARVPALAVLPLANLTGRSEDEFFADGMTDALITELARDPALRVISRQSAMAFKGSRQGLAEVGRALGAEVLVEGSVTRSNGRVRITTQLVRVEEETHVWAGRFDRPLENVLDVHAEVAESVAREVCAALGRARDQSAAVRSSGHRPVDPAAYEAYLKGRYFSAMLPEIPRAIECFRTALARDERFAPAWAGIAMCYANLALFVYLSPGDAFPLLESAARRALALDDSAGEGHTAEGMCRMLAYRDWTGAEAAFRRSVERSPGSADARIFRAVFFISMARWDEGLAEAQLAVELDPLGPGARYTLAWCHYKRREHEQSVRALDETLELYPHFALAHPLRAANLALLGRHGEATDAARLGVAGLPGDQEALMYAVGALTMAGQETEARELLGRLRARGQTGYLDPFSMAVAHAARGDSEAAAQWVRRTYDQRSPSAFCLLTEPLLDPARGEPVFREVMRRLAFPRH